MTSADRRATPRIAHAFVIRYRRPGQPAWCVSTMHDLSLGGLRFVCEFPIEVGMLLDLQLTLPMFPQPIAAKATVIWKRPAQGALTEIGLSFQGLAPGQRQMLERVIAHFLRKQSPR